tara:strand:+ start:377 stop:1705 length:1329 start_codon:yes stop_codon:yes gene_type:complete
MRNQIVIKKKINHYDKKILIPGDKSLSIRWILISSLANGISTAKNLLVSQDVKAAINAIRKLGVKVKINDTICKVYGVGIEGYKYKKGLTINAQNSGTLGRLISGLLVNSPFPIKITGDKSLSKRDFWRIAKPLGKFGARLKLKNNYNLPLTITGSNNLKPIHYIEKKGSAQVKSSIIFAGARTNGKTFIKAKKSRDHTELLFKHLNLPIKVKNKKNFDLIEISKFKKIKPLDYKIPSDLSSCAFFIALTILSKNSRLTISNVNVNPTRTGMLTILRKMGIKITLINKKIYKGEFLADIQIKSPKIIKSIDCPSNLNSGAIDEFLVIFLIAAKAKGVSIFKNLDELNQKESPRLKWGSKILKMMGVKVISKKNSLKIYGNPELSVNKKIVIKDYLKDHRVFMTCAIAALTFGGTWKIVDPESIQTSFPNFLKILKSIGAKIN